LSSLVAVAVVVWAITVTFPVLAVVVQVATALVLMANPLAGAQVLSLHLLSHPVLHTP